LRPVALALAVSGLSALACASHDTPSCPGNTVATFAFEGTLVHPGDPLAPALALDPVPTLPDCTPDPSDASAPIKYPQLLPPFDAKLAANPATNAAALCRPTGVVYSGEHTGTSRYAVEADADPAVPCASSVCSATLRVIVVGDVQVDAGGAPQSFTGILVEALSEDRGSCAGCLPPVPGANPPALACAARYALTGSLR
jgi:hypothetical protein